MTAELNLLSRVAYRDSEITAPRLRGLLALLAEDLHAGCGTARLVDGLWPEERPENPAKALQVLVSRARALLGADVIASTPTGYRLALTDDQVDASAVLARATESARAARSGDHGTALAAAERGLALWHGTAPRPAADPEDPLAVLRAGRATAHRALTRGRALALSRLGRRAEAVEPLTEAFAEHPRDEEILLELLRCEAATLGASAALARYDRYRTLLRDELGTDPGAALKAAHRELLQAEAPVVRHGVTHEPNPLLGRATDIEAVTALLHTSRVTSVVGPGGLGKTRLAHAVARAADQRVVQFVALAGVTSEDDVAGEVAGALGVREKGGAELVPSMVAALAGRSTLLVLDNCEHVLDGVAELVGALVSMAPEVLVLTTSRAPLGLSSETVYALPELDLAVAVELFGQRARAARPNAELPARQVEEICRHLDGLPLAVELAAARIRVMSVAEIARNLDDRFALLRGGARDAPERHQTLRAVVDWSWNLLGDEPRAALRALSVFPGGFSAAAARHLLGADVVDALDQLTEQSLLRNHDSVGGIRFAMLETVREFCAAHRAAEGESQQVVDGFLAWVRDLAAARYRDGLGPQPFAFSAVMRAEQDNLLLALRIGLERGDGATVAAATALLGGMWTVDTNHVRISRLNEEVDALLSHYRPEPEHADVAVAAITTCLANTFLVSGPGPFRSYAALRRLPEPPIDGTFGAIVHIIRNTGRYLGRDHRAIRELCDRPERWLAGAAGGVYSYIAEASGDVDGAMATAWGMLASFDGRTDPWMRCMAHGRISDLCLQQDRPEEARDQLEAALRLMEGLDEWTDEVGVRWGLVMANLQVGDIDAAETWMRQIWPEAADKFVGVLRPDFGIQAEIHLARGKIEEGLRLWRSTTLQAHGIDRVDTYLRAWALEAESVAVVAHARHGRIDLVAELADTLPGKLVALMPGSESLTSPTIMYDPLRGIMLAAIGMTDIARARETGDEESLRRAVKLVALAERLRFLRGFQPTMSPAGIRAAVREAGGPAYDEAVSSYAGLDTDGVRAAAAALLAERATASDRG